jgi:hypothetical protein
MRRELLHSLKLGPQGGRPFTYFLEKSMAKSSLEKTMAKALWKKIWQKLFGKKYDAFRKSVPKQ